MQFGVPIRPETQRQVAERGMAVGADYAEVVWWQFYDSQAYVSATTTRQRFFSTANNDKTITNLAQPGQIPSPQQFQIYNVCLDVRSTLPVTLQTAVGPLTTAGVLNDLALLIGGLNERPTWSLFLSSKEYGPFTLLTLGGTGGVSGFGYGSSIATSSGQIQYARNDPSNGWNYFGNIVITQQSNFYIELNWAAAATLTADKLNVVSMFGILNRKVQ